MEQLVRVMHDNHADRPIDFEQLTDLAATGGLFDRITDGHTAKGMERADKARLGKLLASYSQRVFGDARITFLVEGRGHGRRFRVNIPAAATNAENPF